jgi:hypothetical protein
MFRWISRLIGASWALRRIRGYWKSTCLRARPGRNFKGGWSIWKSLANHSGYEPFERSLPSPAQCGFHFLFGGVSIEQNPFFSRPQWLASILRFWQHHPSLSYLFTGPYVGTSSQAPRPDESRNALLDLELAYRQLENLPGRDSRQEIHELLRHLHTDVSGNTHRSKTSFDKFWSPPNGDLGLIEFRAIESLPSAEIRRGAPAAR